VQKQEREQKKKQTEERKEEAKRNMRGQLVADLLFAK
jgi:hypothetical protein